MARTGHPPEFPIEVTRRLFAAGVALQDTAAIAADPLVRRKIENVLDDLDQAVKIACDYLFGVDPAPAGDSPDGKAQYWLRHSELALDLAAAALSRAGEVEGDWGQDAVLRSKLAMMRDSVTSH